ncbi:coiled-coil domain-containing protein 151 isoform X2 [Hoplias malabaricus]|uniref:coiled-coil domain-containing protein 151 isoform X2 n=1 Tax=Hoplias malabaricus TaxID=27720 RepID=UPI003461B1D5
MPSTSSSSSIKPSVHEQITELQQKIQLLEGDRDAYFESSQNTIKTNRENILHLREENKRLGARLQHTLSGDEQGIREVFQSRAEKATFRNMSGKAAVQVLDQKVCDKVKKLNALKHATHTLHVRLEELREQHNRLRTERTQHTANTTNLRVLENRLEKAQLKCHEAEHIMKSYLKIKEYLQEESLMFQPQLDQLEDEILRQRQELRELEEMNSGAHLAKETAKAELQRQEEQVYRERRERELILNHYKKQAEERRAQVERGERRAQRVALHPDEQSSEAQRSVTGVRDEQGVVSSLQEVFNRIREITGVTNSQEVLDRFVSQGDTQRHLKQMKMENEQKLQQLKDERDTLLTHFQELKFTGETTLTSARQEVEEYERHLEAEQQRRDSAKEKLDWLSHTLNTVRAGVEHLTDKLQHITLAEVCVQQGDADYDVVVKMLKEAEQKLQQIQEEFQDKDLTSLLKEMEDEEFYASIEGKLPQYNTRVTLPDTQRPDLYEEEEDSGDDEGEVISRVSLKRQSQLIIDSKTKRKTRLKKKKGKL